MLVEPTWLEFERGIAGLAEAFGYEGQTTPPSGDFGVDVIATRGDRKVVIQCKLHKTGAIGAGDILKLAGSRQYFGADEAICFATSGYTQRARQAAEKLGVHLVDREGFLSLCHDRAITLPRLTCIDLEGTEFWDLPLSIGRHPDCSIWLNSPFVSRNHLEIVRVGLSLVANDLESSNGTTLNGGRLQKPTALRYGDELRVAEFLLTVKLRI